MNNMKVQAKFLVAKSKILRNEERKAKKKTRSFKPLLARLDEYTEEQKARIEKNYAKSQSNSFQLYYERAVNTRKESREIHLTRMFLRGTPLSKVESKFYTKANVKNIEKLIYTWYPGRIQEGLQRLTEWLEEGGYEKYEVIQRNTPSNIPAESGSVTIELRKTPNV